MRNIYVIFLLLFLGACSSQPVPQWKDTSFRQLENYRTNFLSDNEDETEPHLAKAKKAAASNNDLNLLATIYLTKYALHVATLEIFSDSEFLRIDRLQPNPTTRSYYDFLKGNFTAIDINQLPASYSRLLPLMIKQDSTAALREIASIADPLSRLIACGVWVKYLPDNEMILQIAIDTSAQQGWRRPLWAYLTALQKYYSIHQETSKAEKIKERLELLNK